MLITCTPCSGTGSSGGVSCTVCGGDGELDLTDANFKGIRVGDQIAIMGVVWDSLLTSVADIEGKLDAIDTKLDTIDVHLDTIETKIDALGKTKGWGVKTSP